MGINFQTMKKLIFMEQIPLNSDTDEDGLTDYEEMKAWVI